MEETLNDKLEELKNIYESLVIVKDGKSYLKSGASEKQLEYALSQFENISGELKRLKEKQEISKKKINKINEKIGDICKRGRPTAEKLIEKCGENSVPTWYKKYLGL